jgi:DNA-binding Lrp family transcriptional regulator
MRLDEHDMKILEKMKSGIVNGVEIAKLIGLDFKTVYYRIRHMKRFGIIIGKHTVMQGYERHFTTRRYSKKTAIKNIEIGELDDNLKLLAKTLTWAKYEAEKRKVDVNKIDVMEVMKIIRDRNAEMKFGRESE